MKIGVLGGGQLGRMLGMAGLPLAIEPVFWEPEASACAQLIGQHLCAPYEDEQALTRFARDVDVCTYEFENVPSPVLTALAAKVPVYPPLAALEVSQDRLTEKQLFATLDIRTAPYAAVDSEQDLRSAVAQLGLPAVLKTRRFGYDGKGQFVIRHEKDIATAWQALGSMPLILEGFVNFSREVSIIAVRGKDGTTVFYPLSENVHRNGILFTSRALPADAKQEQAETFARKLLAKLDYVGVLCLELFEINGELVANEFAPRVHNSGHWTIEGSETSQFENHLRAVCGLPLGSTTCVGFPAMVNLVGKLPALHALLDIPQAHVHFYGKSEKPARKVGHVTVRADSEMLCEQRIAAVLQLVQEKQA
ncbi:MAG: 5-(carboxyamino)imidazole ribonucleotide synthase [Pseudomonadales bacterium]|jgi:5-(carboxyamino)imidazole ribonucleotide synthase|nr:5-(carboxyamino)imidazole ribonucleotide synthase [Cellvibrionales bacterium]MBP8029821.1 5-(carboxyamino)imidazole ribonucleotide synthase [Pseudomonadales bacterium]